MQSRLIPHATILCGLLLCHSTFGAVVGTFDDDLTFSSSLGTGFATESFEGLFDGDQGVSSWSTTAGSYGFSFATDASDTLWTGLDSDGSRFLSTWGNNMPLTINITSGTATAIGGYVFLTDYNGDRVDGSLTFTLGNGEVFGYSTTSTDRNYLGVLSTAATSITSVLVTTETDNAWITIDKVAVGQAIPEPSTYAAILGALVFGLTFWRRRSKRWAPKPVR